MYIWKGRYSVGWKWNCRTLSDNGRKYIRKMYLNDKCSFLVVIYVGMSPKGLFLEIKTPPTTYFWIQIYPSFFSGVWKQTPSNQPGEAKILRPELSGSNRKESTPKTPILLVSLFLSILKGKEEKTRLRKKYAKWISVCFCLEKTFLSLISHADWLRGEEEGEGRKEERRDVREMSERDTLIVKMQRDHLFDSLSLSRFFLNYLLTYFSLCTELSEGTRET